MPRARGPRAGPKRRGEESRERILDAALALFRREGFDAATMRDVAAAAGMSLGAAYYYFPSKEAIVLGYYEKVFAERRRRAHAAFAESESLRDRLRAVYLLHFDGVRRDRKLLGALVRSVADPDSQVSVFSGDTEAVRRGSIALFREAVSLPEVPEELRDRSARAVDTRSGADALLHLGRLTRAGAHPPADRRRHRHALADGAALVDALGGRPARGARAHARRCALAVSLKRVNRRCAPPRVAPIRPPRARPRAARRW
jgi:AcrR family transcriptional regulator